ncbi:MAG: hypothetical protein ACRD4B_03055, partial [Acidobacteriota bacterium]
ITTAIDASDAEIVTALATGDNDLSGTDWTIDGATGNFTTTGTINANGGTVTTNQTTANLFNTTATTINFGGAATSLTIGANNAGTATIRNQTISLPSAIALNANLATAAFDVVNIGGGYGATGASIASSGNIQTNGALTVDGTATLTGAVTASSGLTINGTTTTDLMAAKTTANLFNTTATTINFGGAATSLSIGANGGTTTINGGLTIANGQTLTANGIANIGDGGDAVTLSGAMVTLTANGAGNDITANLVDNNTNALDIQEGSNNYININTTNSSENISFGNATTNPTYSFLGNGTLTTSGDIGINGGDLISSQTTFNLLNTGVTTLNLGGAATTLSIGAGSGTSTINNNLTVSGATSTFASTAINLSGSNPAIDLTSATTLGLNTVTNRPITTGTGLFTVGGTLSVSTVTAPASSALTINAGTTGANLVQIANTSTGNVEIAGGSGATGCTITNSNGNLACSGTISSNGNSLTSGSGTANQVAYFNGTSSLTSSSNLTLSSDNLGVGTTSTGDKLAVQSATANNGTIVMQDDFDPNTDGSQWQTLSNVGATNNCGGVSGNVLRFNGAGTRRAETIDLNVSNGGTLQFYIFAPDSSTSNCENPNNNEDIQLEYSTGGGYTTLATYDSGDYDPTTLITVNIPVGAQSSGTSFRWTQTNHSGNNFDNWSIDNVVVTAAANPSTVPATIYGYNTSASNGVDLFRLASDVSGTTNVKFRVQANGDVYADGTYYGAGGVSAGSADLAEIYGNIDGASAGDVVTFTGNTIVGRSNAPYQQSLAGVVSTKPGFTLNASEQGIPVALSGRVPVKVSTEAGIIKKGDFLTSSSTVGFAMKATQSGQMIGRALEDFDGIDPEGDTGGFGRIEVFVNVSFGDPKNVLQNFTVDDEGQLLISNISSDSINLPAGLVINGQIINGTLTDGLLAINAGLTDATAHISGLQTDVLGITDHIDALDIRVTDLENNEASQSAQLAELEQRLATLEDPSASPTATLTLTPSASPSGTPTPTPTITEPETLLASGSAIFTDITVHSTATISGEFSAYQATVQDTFRSFGNSYLGDTTIAGTVMVTGQTMLEDTSISGILSVDDRINVAGTLSITENAISVFGTPVTSGEEPTDGILYLQNSPLANLLDIFDGKLTIDREGNLKTEGTIEVGGDLKIEGGITTTATAGEAIQAGDALYISAANTVMKADGTDADKAAVIGIAANDAAIDEEVTVIIGGKAKGFTSLNIGERYYVETNGSITTTPPTGLVSPVSIGIAFSTTELLIQIAPEN